MRGRVRESEQVGESGRVSEWDRVSGESEWESG